MTWLFGRALNPALRSSIAMLTCCSLFVLAAANSQAQNLITNPGFDTDLSGWLIASGGVNQTTIGHDSSEGLPPGSAKLDRVISDEFDNKDILYQLIPVQNGLQYNVDAQWKGDLLNGGTGRNWAEVMVTFLPTGDPIPNGADFPDDWIQYKKATDGGPHTPPNGVFDWESILDSPDGGPTDGWFTATDDWMLVGFNLGGRAEGSNNTQPGFYWVDNVSVTAIPEPTTIVLLMAGGLAMLARRSIV